jgi:hypothetical protein
MPKQAERRLFLFNDMLLITKPVYSKQSTKFKVLKVFPLLSFTVADAPIGRLLSAISSQVPNSTTPTVSNGTHSSPTSVVSPRSGAIPYGSVISPRSNDGMFENQTHTLHRETHTHREREREREPQRDTT